VQVGAQLVGGADSVRDQVAAGAAGAAQRGGLGAVGDQRVQPGPVGAQRVGEDERVEPVVFVAGRAVAAAQVLDLVRADHHDREAGVEQRLDHGPIRAFDRYLGAPRAGEHLDQFPQPGRAVLDAAPEQFAAAGVHDRDRVIITGPVQATGHTARRLIGQLAGHGSAGRLHVSLLAASPSGEAPSYGAGTRLPVRSLIGAQRRSALSTVGTSRVTTRPRKSHVGHPPCQATKAMTWRHLGRITDPSKISDLRMVHQ
jgi:hypothetical protein